MSHAIGVKDHERPFIVSGSLFLVSFILEIYLSMFDLPYSQFAMLDWVSWILAGGGAILFVSALINHKNHR